MAGLAKKGLTRLHFGFEDHYAFEDENADLSLRAAIR